LTRNSARDLERCLKSVIEEKPGEIIAVDAHSTSGKRAPIRLRDEDVRRSCRIDGMLATGRRGMCCELEKIIGEEFTHNRRAQRT
jgi:hypothetical protein